jgi:hypothetical protein
MSGRVRSSQILPIQVKQIKGDEDARGFSEEQILEHRPGAFLMSLFPPVRKHSTAEPGTGTATKNAKITLKNYLFCVFVLLWLEVPSRTEKMSSMSVIICGVPSALVRERGKIVPAIALTAFTTAIDRDTVLSGSFKFTCQAVWSLAA